MNSCGIWSIVSENGWLHFTLTSYYRFHLSVFHFCFLYVYLPTYSLDCLHGKPIWSPIESENVFHCRIVCRGFFSLSLFHSIDFLRMWSLWKAYDMKYMISTCYCFAPYGHHETVKQNCNQIFASTINAVHSVMYSEFGTISIEIRNALI